MMDIKEYYNTNENFRTYVDQMRRIHQDVSVDDILAKKMVKEVASYYQEKEKE